MQDTPGRGSFSCNGRTYQKPRVPTVVVCIDGSEPGYIEAAIAAGRAPHFERLMRDGANLIAQSVVPSFTNPNNMSIITGRPPSVHGIAGNYFFDPVAGKEVMMNDARFLRAPTIMQAFHDAGGRVAIVTAKDKLRGLLCKDIDMSSGRVVGFSSEKADQVSKSENGIADVLGLAGMALPDVYSSELSEFVFAAGCKLLETFKPDLMYLSTTDYIQHKAAPGSQIANDFYAMMDGYVGEMDRAGAILALTADHGMNDKHRPDTTPDVIYLEELFDAWLGRSVEEGGARVILPITDPYVVHHGALGSFATVYLPPGSDRADLSRRLLEIDGIDVAISREEACQRFELPEDRIGDLVIVSGRHQVLGTSASRHDLSGLNEPLRSHGGISEQTVPLICNRRVMLPDGLILRNFDAFDVALNRIS
ncbi:MAG TPA: phosphonoacetate hydrolase [Hyphomicrobiaceae bacterium]|nr:phosphonoacetate hydrolase [Hyphomicrobiaceae bacterium]